MRPTAERRDPWEGRKKLLVVADVQTGYHHDSISHAMATLAHLGRSSGEFVAVLRTDSQLITRQPILGQGPKYGGKRVNARNLHDFDAIFLLPSGEGTLSDEQKSDLLAFVQEDGKGLLAGHAATLGFLGWPEFGELLGARFGGELVADAEVIVEAPDFPGADAFGLPRFNFTEQHPVLKEPYDRDKVQVILRLDPASLSAEQRARYPTDDLPVVWTRRDGAGRVFNVGWGHEDSTWDDPRFQQLILGGIRWAMGERAAAL